MLRGIQSKAWCWRSYLDFLSNISFGCVLYLPSILPFFTFVAGVRSCCHVITVFLINTCLQLKMWSLFSLTPKFYLFSCPARILQHLIYVSARLSKGADESMLPPGGHTFDIKLEKDIRQVHRSLQRLLSTYKDEKRGPTFIAVQSPKGKKKIPVVGTEHADSE